MQAVYLESVAKKKQTSPGVASKLYDARTASVKQLPINKIKKCQQELSAQNCGILFLDLY